MIGFLIGEVAGVGENLISLDVGGVGYRVTAPTSVCAAVRPGQTGVTVHTTLIFSDNRIDLYGFMTPEERDIFELLITVSGIGPKAGIRLMSLPKSRLVEAIAAEDVAALTTIQGIGPKTAKRLVLELKDKISELYQGGASAAAGMPVLAEGEIGVAAQGLMSLGYSNSEVRNMIKRLPVEEMKKLSATEIIKRCLRRTD
jgi:holliday junction DNA helicase RuvA